jgi:4-hydroxy-tetrahydrodipicolinate synthase
VKELLPLHGIVTVLNTPFTEDDRIDTASLACNVRIAVDAGVAGFLVPAMASEVAKLTDAERVLMVETTLEATDGRVPVIGGASADDPDTRVRVAQSLIDAGCEGVLASIPYESDVQYTEAVRALDTLQPKFLMLQDWDFGGYGLPVPLIAKLFEEVESFRCLKVEVVPAGPKYTEVLDATDGGLHVSGGWAVMQIIEAMDRGVHAFMPTGMHALYVTIHRLYQEGRRDEAVQLFNELLPVLAFSNQHLDISIHFFKRLLCAEDTYATARVREPIQPFDAQHARTAEAHIARVRELTDSLSHG